LVKEKFLPIYASWKNFFEAFLVPKDRLLLRKRNPQKANLMAKTKFPDPIAPKIVEKKIKTPWNFECPSYDDRTSICAGTNYGVGFNSPVGRVGNPTKEAKTLPKGRPPTMRTDNRDFTSLDLLKDY